eukprot:9070385-Alexandrium_andersonii.AAC.1
MRRAQQEQRTRQSGKSRRAQQRPPTPMMQPQTGREKRSHEGHRPKPRNKQRIRQATKLRRAAEAGKASKGRRS